MKKTQEELAELTKVKVGDVVITEWKSIGIVSAMDNSTCPYHVGNQWHPHATKIDPNKTVKEILGL